MLEPPASGADTAGTRLARARVRAALTVEQVAEKLRLDRSTVAALEADDHSSIGAAVFVRGFLRRYASLVGESPTEIEALYAQRPDAVLRPDLSRTGMHRIEPDAHDRKLGLVPAVIAALVLGIIGAIWWAVRTKPRSYTVVTEEHTQIAAPAASAPAPAAVSPAPDTAPAATAATAAPAATPLPATSTSASAAVSAASLKPLELSLSGESWVEIYDARGMRLFFGFAHSGTTQTLNGAPPFRFVLGNVPAVALSLGGAGVSLPEAAPGARVHFTLDASGVVAGVR
ncbi:MAG: helix-turn-helix domain-containing protein [Steroidobacteraceae bacterium]